MRTAVAIANEMYQHISTLPSLVRSVVSIQNDAIAEGHRQAAAPLQELSDEVDRRLERMRNGQLWEDPEA